MIFHRGSRKCGQDICRRLAVYSVETPGADGEVVRVDVGGWVEIAPATAVLQVADELVAEDAAAEEEEN